MTAPATPSLVLLGSAGIQCVGDVCDVPVAAPAQPSTQAIVTELLDSGNV